jgi:uncharacterized membrane protein
MHIREYAHQHLAVVLLILFCAWLSLSLIARLWLAHRNDPFGKRIVWSLVLCVPFFGWLLYGAFYTHLSKNDVKAPVNQDAFNAGH